MTDFSNEPLSAHERIQAEALIKKYDEAARIAYHLGPVNGHKNCWVSLAACVYFAEKTVELRNFIESGDWERVRIELRYPSMCPQDRPQDVQRVA